MGACYKHLSYADRLLIDEGHRAGLSLRAIARKLSRAPSNNEIVELRLSVAPCLSNNRA